MIKLMIVEDVKIVRETLVHHVNWAAVGLTVVASAQDGEQALALMQHPGNVPDLLITDIGMPVMDGIELIRRVKEMNPRIKCIILSGLSEFEYAREGLKMGVMDYVLKPIDTEEILRMAERSVRFIKKEQQQLAVLQQAKEIVKEALPHVVGESAGLPELPGKLKNSKLVEQMLKYIHQNIQGKPLALQQVAAQANLSEKYAAHLFKEATGTTVNNYIIARKMELASQLLKNPETKIYEVCDQIGYSDIDHFRDSFKRHHGLTPSEYRNRYL
ncbi:response regulator transcription factor [Gorillibacterium massiliense]|uniref:response regulator transcription factor n=1 Tax=Gorillibacterium massiliense TaxID=1280390 RepID=UPI0004B35D8C|nr:response regulator [Gorillibacterium massiliense]